MSRDGALAPLIEAASAYYRVAGRFAWHFARGKLGADPVFAAVLASGLLGGRTRILDLGCGQALLAAWLLAAHACHASAEPGAWPEGWPAPPAVQSYAGIEINATTADGRTALDGARTLRFESVVKFLTEKGAKAGTGGGRGARQTR